MEITIQINGQTVFVAVTVEVYESLDQAAHKNENLAHEQRRQRFFLYALEGMSYAEIGRHCSR